MRTAYLLGWATLLLAPAFAQTGDRADGAYVSPAPLHRATFAPGDEALARLRAAGAVAREIDYGSFTFAVLDERPLGGRGALAALGVALRDQEAVLGFNGAPLDTADAAGLTARLDAIPPALRAPAAHAGTAAGRDLRIVQFVGPVRDEWLDRLRATGARVISYVASNGFVVQAEPAALEALAADAALQWTGPYHPFFRLAPELRELAVHGSGSSDVTVQVIAGDDAGPLLAMLAAFPDLGVRSPVLDYVNVRVRLPDALLALLASHPSVFGIEPLHPAERLDEAQGQIMAGNLNAGGTGPSGPGYLSWLLSKGFASAGQFAFAVDVEDDGVDRGSITDINVEFRVGGVASGASRLVYNNNYTSDPLADGGGGHGNLNASVIGGWNDLSGTAWEDAGGFNYGLGLCPFVQIGNSKVFANSGAGQFNQPTSTRMRNAWNGGARISSNSWGYTAGNNYNADTQAHDVAVRDAVSTSGGNQELCIVFAAGNSGPGANTVRPPGTGKNIITVAAGENQRQTGTDGCGIGNTGANDARDIISFSGRGPCSDGRRKPDLAAPGTHIQGAASRSTVYNGAGVCNQYWPAGQTLYAWSSGTSHSTPAVAGAAALVRQHFVNQGWPVPSAAMTKAWLMGTTRHMTGVGANDTLWSNSQGMGSVDLGRAFDGVTRLRVDQANVLGTTGQVWTTSGSIVSPTQPFRVALAWTDAPGPTTGSAWVNNLDLEVTVNGTLYRGNVFSGAGSVTGGAADATNNAEFVFLPAGTSGSFAITVRAANVAGDGVPGNADTTDQDFALVVYNGDVAAPVPDFTLSATPPSRTVVQGQSTTYAVSNAPTGGFASGITLSASPALAGVTYGFAPNPMAAGGGSTLTVTTTAAAPAGNHTVTISGTGGGLTRTTAVTLSITTAPVPDFTLSATPSSRTITQGQSTTYAVSNAPTGGFASSITLSASPAIAGVSYGFAPNPVAAGGGSTLTVTTTAAATTGNHTVTISGTGGGLTRTTAVTLVINPPVAGDAVRTYSAAPNLAIPDNNATGVTSGVSVGASQTITSVAVSVSIVHTYRGDLVLTLIAPGGTTRLLHNRAGGSADNVITTYAIATTPAESLALLNGQGTLGTWQLRVQDLAAIDVGTLQSWSITFNGEKSVAPNLAIPDNNATGVSSAIAFTAGGTVASVRVRVGITHTYRGDLVVTLIAPDGTPVILHNRAGGSLDNLNTEYPDLTAPAQSLGPLAGKAIAGSWTLRVQDLAAIDVGTLNSWTISFTAQPAP